MIKLTQQQLAILASAEAQPDGFATRPPSMKPSAAAKVVAKLLKQGLVRELLAKGDAPIWREDEHGRPYSLKVLKAGRALVASAEHAVTGGDVENIRESASQKRRGSMSEGDLTAKKAHTKRDQILALMARKGGATLADLIAATGWLPHTTRAALTGLRKSGFAIERNRDEGGRSSIYRVEPVTIAAAS